MTTFTTQDRQDAQRTPLNDEQIDQIIRSIMADPMIPTDELLFLVARAIERAHGIGE